MSDVLGAAWRTVAFGWRFGSALVGLVVFAILGTFVPAGYGNLVWNGGILLTGVAFVVFAFLGSFRTGAAPPRTASRPRSQAPALRGCRVRRAGGR